MHITVTNNRSVENNPKQWHIVCFENNKNEKILGLERKLCRE